MAIRSDWRAKATAEAKTATVTPIFRCSPFAFRARSIHLHAPGICSRFQSKQPLEALFKLSRLHVIRITSEVSPGVVGGLGLGLAEAAQAWDVGVADARSGQCRRESIEPE